MPDIKVVIIGFSLLIIALDKIVPKDNPSYKVITYVVRGIMLETFNLIMKRTTTSLIVKSS